ncbi:hypothetical protein BDV19DRAFT_67061 [Aspergillus venezuelensis]
MIQRRFGALYGSQYHCCRRRWLGIFLGLHCVGATCDRWCLGVDKEGCIAYIESVPRVFGGLFCTTALRYFSPSYYRYHLLSN